MIPNITYHLILILGFILSGCATCQNDKIVPEGFVKYVAKSLQCSKLDLIRKDVMSLCSNFDLCDKSRLYAVEPLDEEASWSKAHLYCQFIIGAIELMPSQNVGFLEKTPRWKTWGCKRSDFPSFDLDKVCAKI